MPIPHVHPIQTERFAVTHGRVKFRLGLRTVYASPGDVVEVPPGVAHSFANAGDGEARMQIEVTPALSLAEMFTEVVELAHAGRMNRRGLPRNLFELASLARRYDDEAHAPRAALDPALLPRPAGPVRANPDHPVVRLGLKSRRRGHTWKGMSNAPADRRLERPALSLAPHDPFGPVDVVDFGARLRSVIREPMQIADETLEIVLSTLLAGGHLLLEDRPGVGKTQLARTLAGAVDGRFAASRRPSTCCRPTSSAPRSGMPGPRSSSSTPARSSPTSCSSTSSTARRRKRSPGCWRRWRSCRSRRRPTHPLPRPFMVIATQNPSVGYDGTYRAAARAARPLPRARLARLSEQRAGDRAAARAAAAAAFSAPARCAS